MIKTCWTEVVFMLIGTILGIIITLMLFALSYQRGACKTYQGQIVKLNEELYGARGALGRFVHLEQERQRLKEGIVINFTEEQITTLAGKVGARVQTIIAAAQEEQLGKLN
jgi:hypothetical protein